jgi:hypothetical protein
MRRQFGSALAAPTRLVLIWLDQPRLLAEKEKAAEFEPDGSKWSLAGGAKPCVSTKPSEHSPILGNQM